MAPNANSLRLLVVLIAVWYAGASQNNAAAYLLGFLIFGLACVSSTHTWANLCGIRIAAQPIPPVYEGEPLVVPLSLQSRNGRPHYAIQVAGAGEPGSATVDEILPSSSASIEVMLASRPRGRYAEVPLQLSTVYPLGLFTRRLKVVLAGVFYIYPKPAGDLPLPADPARTPQGADRASVEGDDFAGVREWRLGESMRHIDWRAVARGQPLMSKQWNGGVADRLVLDWGSLPGLPTEDRLRQLARWIIVSERASATYELRLPSTTVTFGRGDTHLHACMRALAEFPRDAAAPEPVRAEPAPAA